MKKFLLVLILSLFACKKNFLPRQDPAPQVSFTSPDEGDISIDWNSNGGWFDGTGKYISIDSLSSAWYSATGKILNVDSLLNDLYLPKH